VVGYDISRKAVEKANDCGLDATCDELPCADVYVIAVSTGICDDDTPDMSNIFDVCEKISRINPESLVCVESTLSMGTCREISEKFSLNRIVHCPHRYWAGDVVNCGIVQTRVFGALNDESYRRGKTFYEKQKIPIFEVSSVEIAEMCKVAENAYRFVQIAFAEELKTICDEVGLPFEELRESCNTKWNIEILEARDGIGGHCIPKDVRYLWTLLESPLLDGAIEADEAYKKLKREK
jgi:nucleotide sugar dehydrogenase